MLRTLKINDSKWNVLSGEEVIGYIERKREKSAFGGAWINRVYIGGIKKGIIQKYPSTLTNVELERFVTVRK